MLPYLPFRAGRLQAFSAEGVQVAGRARRAGRAHSWARRRAAPARAL